MALFGKKDKEAEVPSTPATVPLVGKTAFCTVCNAYRQFTRCWRRAQAVRQCACCGLAFENVAALYSKNQPACPRCGEFLEHPGFEYGLCDSCGTKFELVEGAKPGMLPNLEQRKRMMARAKGTDKPR